MITSFYPPYNFGGDGIYVHGLSNELARRGHQVDVIHCKDAYRVFAHREPAQAYHDHPRVTVHGLESPFGLLSPLLTQQTGLPLLKSSQIRRILDQGFDVIHFHTVSLVGGPGVLSYGHSIKLYTAHDHWLVCPTRVLFRFNRELCTRRYCFLCSLTHKRPPQLWRYTGLLKAAVKHVDSFIVGSRFSRDKHRELGLGAPITYLPSFVPAQDHLRTSERDSIEKPEEPYLLFVGRLRKIKGLQTLIRVFRGYAKAHLLVAGTGRYEQHLRQMARGSENIRFLGHLAREQLSSLYRDAVAVILPSIACEVSPLVILEAFQQQTPVIVRDRGGMPEYVKESGGGFIYNTDEELIAAMDWLLADRAHRDELGFRGYKAYSQKWTADAHLKRYLALIHHIRSASTLLQAQVALAPMMR